MSRALQEFTAKVPFWRPYVTPVELDLATPEQRDAMKVTPSNQKISEYTLVLAHDPESLTHRSPLFNDVMFHRGGLARAERELGAVGASIVNRCIYCAAVHAERYNQLTKSEDVMTHILSEDTDPELEPRTQAILDFSRKLSESPSAADARDLRALRDVGLSPEQILDLVLSVALFGWANRLMHTLGEPIATEDESR